MNNIDYVARSLATEAPITEEMVARFLDPNVMAVLHKAVCDMILQGARMDCLKKHLFYGQPKLDDGLPEGCYAVSPAVAERLRDPGTIRLLHAAIGMATETAEIFEELFSHIFAGKPLDTINLIEEMGDQFWYQAVMADTCSVTFDDIMERNTRKLSQRYLKYLFDKGAALNRDLVAERTALENKEK